MTDVNSQPRDIPPTGGANSRVERFTSEQRGVVLGAAVVLLVIVALGVVAFTFGRNRSTTNLGDDRFQDIRADLILVAVNTDGPVFFPDLTDGGRDIYVTHVGPDPIRGFLAMSARSDATGCLVQWHPETAEFSDVCDAGLTYDQHGESADGALLQQYPVELKDGRLLIDINFADRAPTSVGSGS